MIKYYGLPFKFYLNEPFFANIEWYLYRFFHIKRKYPCGVKRDKYNCCHQPFFKDRVYLSNDKTECFCKVCGSKRISANYEINLDKVWDF